MFAEVVVLPTGIETEINEKGRRLGRGPMTAAVEDQGILLTQIKSASR